MSHVNEKIWITGTSSGIGKSIANVFANSGYNVYATARRKETLELHPDAIQERAAIKYFQVDISSKEDVFLFVDKTFGGEGIDCLINNAGITSFAKVEQNSIKDIESIIQTNMLGSIYTIKAVLPLMIKKNKGTIINILSVVTEKIFQQSGAYSASKAGLKAFSQVLREEVRRYNIRVVNVYPAATNTDIWSEENKTKFAHRMMNPDDVANIILSIYKQTGNLVTEEIVLKPIEGDL